MPLSTTVIGSFPKPPYLHIPDWFSTSQSGSFTERYNRFLVNPSASETEELIIRATKEVIDIQAEAGVDVITDGELRRENYILHFAGRLKPPAETPKLSNISKYANFSQRGHVNDVSVCIFIHTVCDLHSIRGLYFIPSLQFLLTDSSSLDMPLSTTVIGSFPKPSFLNVPDWFQPAHAKDSTEEYNRFLQNSTPSAREELFTRAIRETVELQTEAGLDVITDGEVRRENYLHYFCRRLAGFDFNNLCLTAIRDESAVIAVPRIVGEVSLQENEAWVWKEWKISQDLSKLPMKITLPGTHGNC
ncbi:hypothetical protein OS493_031526 [Desmophyllum pertusum]|uniref:Cobalamin-independent methionine synthase MetE C-terminal/archaeal domain-containing protein n=1 Tax=Desmophyllum pertusum TaxID=174260 RepID=A0A9W9Z8U9_9CNID|nr:hypothetical protein OS493_031526 [Desmophyllum pertusum]